MAKLTFAKLDDESEVDIAIIGAGISGIYCAYRLLTNPEFKDKKIAIYERLNRTGGRLQSDLIPIPDERAYNETNNTILKSYKVDKVKEEQGGMRFNYGMTELMQLNQSMGLCDQIVPFPMTSANSFPGKADTNAGHNTNRYCIRGHSFSVQDSVEGGNMIWSQLYDLYPQEVGLSPGQLITNAYNRILLANDIIVDETSADYWQQFRLEFKWEGIPLNQWELWGLLLNMGYSNECIEMLSNTLGFTGPFKSLANAGDALQILADFPVDPTYFTLKDGYSTLPDAILKKIDKNVSIFLGTNVDSIIGEEGNFSLLLTEAPFGKSSYPNMPGAKTKTVKAKQIICAVAAQGFNALFTRSPALFTPGKNKDPQKLWDSMAGVLGMELMKINLYFHEAWWINSADTTEGANPDAEGSSNTAFLSGRASILFGPNFTDLPINAIYPFYATDDLDVETSPGNVLIKTGIKPAALTLYCDFNNTNFWKGLQNVGPKFTSKLQNVYDDMVPQTVFPASRAVVAEMRKQIGRLFEVTNVPEPVFTSYRLWNGEDDFEYAYHQYNLNANDKEIIDYLCNPFPGFYMCNEAFSDQQGWVNGSLRSSNLALGKISNGAIGPMQNAPCKNTSAAANFKNNTGRKGRLAHNFGHGNWGG